MGNDPTGFFSSNNRPWFSFGYSILDYLPEAILPEKKKCVRGPYFSAHCSRNKRLTNSLGQSSSRSVSILKHASRPLRSKSRSKDAKLQSDQPFCWNKIVTCSPTRALLVPVPLPCSRKLLPFVPAATAPPAREPITARSKIPGNRPALQHTTVTRKDGVHLRATPGHSLPAMRDAGTRIRDCCVLLIRSFIHGYCLCLSVMQTVPAHNVTQTNDAKQSSETSPLHVGLFVQIT